MGGFGRHGAGTSCCGVAVWLQRSRSASFATTQPTCCAASRRASSSRITVHGHPVAQLVALDRAQQLVPFGEVAGELRGAMLRGDRLDEELRDLDAHPRDPFA